MKSRGSGPGNRDGKMYGSSYNEMAPNIVFELWTNKKKLRIDCDLIHYGLMETQYITNHIELSWIFASILEHLNIVENRLFSAYYFYLQFSFEGTLVLITDLCRLKL